MNDTRQALEKDVRDNLLLLYDFDKDYDVKLLKYSENVIFKITFKEAFPVVLRIHRPGYHNIEELEGEILWMDEIHRDTDVELPVVYRGRNGRFLLVKKYMFQLYHFLKEAHLVSLKMTNL